MAKREVTWYAAVGIRVCADCGHVFAVEGQRRPLGAIVRYPQGASLRCPSCQGHRSTEADSALLGREGEDLPHRLRVVRLRVLWHGRDTATWPRSAADAVRGLRQAARSSQGQEHAV